MQPAKIVCYLTVNGGDDAIAFYQKAFDASVLMRMVAEDGKRLMHAHLSMLGSDIMLGDEFSEFPGHPVSPKSLGGTTATVTVNLDAPSDVDALIEKAEAAGAVVSMPASDMFWGARYGRVIDPFGHHWAFNAPQPQ